MPPGTPVDIRRLTSVFADNVLTCSTMLVDTLVTAAAAPSPNPVAECARLAPADMGAKARPSMVRTPDTAPVELATMLEMVQSLWTLSASAWSFPMSSSSSHFTRGNLFKNLFLSSWSSRSVTWYSTAKSVFSSLRC